MKRIVILGAKPGAQLVAGDAVYCANASFLSNPAAVAQFDQRVVVASSLILAKACAAMWQITTLTRRKSKP